MLPVFSPGLHSSLPSNTHCPSASLPKSGLKPLKMQHPPTAPVALKPESVLWLSHQSVAPTLFPSPAVPCALDLRQARVPHTPRPLPVLSALSEMSFFSSSFRTLAQCHLHSTFPTSAPQAEFMVSKHRAQSSARALTICVTCPGL